LYTVFSQFNAPRHLYLTWHGAPGISLKKQFIWARHFSRKGYYSFFLAAACILPLNLKFIIQQINIWGAYLQFHLLYLAITRGPVFNRENTVIRPEIFTHQLSSFVA